MKGIVLHCSYFDCRKLLAKNVSLVAGSFLEIKCAHCGRINYIIADRDGISIRIKDSIK